MSDKQMTTTYQAEEQKFVFHLKDSITICFTYMKLSDTSKSTIQGFVKFMTHHNLVCVIYVYCIMLYKVYLHIFITIAMQCHVE